MPATTTNDPLHALARPRLEELRRTASTLLDLAAADLLDDLLETELYLFRDRLDTALRHPEAQPHPAQ